MKVTDPISVFWFRRDLRLNDNVGLWKALEREQNILPLFIFDSNITDELPKDDARVSFIHDNLSKINSVLFNKGTSILVKKGKPIEIWKELCETYAIKNVYLNRDYEPYAIERDNEIENFLLSKGMAFHSNKDQVIFEPEEILKANGLPYSVFTPYKKKWLSSFSPEQHKSLPVPELHHLVKFIFPFPSLEELGFVKSGIHVLDYDLDNVHAYGDNRDFPSRNATSRLGPHLRFGTVGVRDIIEHTNGIDQTFISELIWREFFKQILYHFPEVVHQNYYRKYDGVAWRNQEKEFEKWSNGHTGYPLVDAGMRQLNATGYMHNRVRMVTASFLCKHLLIDWRWGEAYFARKLLDYDLSANNGNWQWASGTGCDAAPWFRIFNPETQMKKFDRQLEYIKKWVPEYGSSAYSNPMVDHSEARERAISVYRRGIQTYNS